MVDTACNTRVEKQGTPRLALNEPIPLLETTGSAVIHIHPRKLNGKQPGVRSGFSETNASQMSQVVSQPVTEIKTALDRRFEGLNLKLQVIHPTSVVVGLVHTQWPIYWLLISRLVCFLSTDIQIKSHPGSVLAPNLRLGKTNPEEYQGQKNVKLEAKPLEGH